MSATAQAEAKAYEDTCCCHNHEIVIRMQIPQSRCRYPDIQPEANHRQADPKQNKSFALEFVHGVYRRTVGSTERLRWVATKGRGRRTSVAERFVHIPENKRAGAREQGHTPLRERGRGGG